MSILLGVMSMVVLAGLAHVDDNPRAIADPWNRIRSFLEQGTAHENPELVAYLKSLTAEEMLAAGRQACEEVARRLDGLSNAMRAEGAAMDVAVCLEHYLGKCQSVNEGIKTVLGIVSDSDESPLFRRAIIRQMSSSPFNRFVDELQAYVETHIGEVHGMLTKILEDPSEQPVLRDAALSTIAEGLRERMIKVCAADPNVRQVKERTHRIVPVGEMVRSGKLSLTEDTWNLLKPIEERILANAQVLLAIVAEKDDAPEGLRARAKFMLELYGKLPFTGEGQAGIDKALQDVRG